MTYYIAKGGDEHDLRPMTREESVEMYRQLIEEDPHALADLYIDFYDFSRIEFLIFKDRLSSAILIANSTKRGVDQLESKLEAQQQDGSHRVPGWEMESDLGLSESLAVTSDARGISIGATIATAVAALESLLIDLTLDSESRPEGLYRLLQAFLRRHAVPKSKRTEITGMGLKVGDRRNTFAHSLTGSYWETDPSIAAKFTPETMEDTLYTVGRIAVLMEEIVLA